MVYVGKYTSRMRTALWSVDRLPEMVGGVEQMFDEHVFLDGLKQPTWRFVHKGWTRNLCLLGVILIGKNPNFGRHDLLNLSPSWAAASFEFKYWLVLEKSRHYQQKTRKPMVTCTKTPRKNTRPLLLLVLVGSPRKYWCKISKIYLDVPGS